MLMGACGEYPSPRLKQNVWGSERTNHPSTPQWPRGRGIWATNLLKNTWALFTWALDVTHAWIPRCELKIFVPKAKVFSSACHRLGCVQVRLIRKHLPMCGLSWHFRQWHMAANSGSWMQPAWHSWGLPKSSLPKQCKALEVEHIMK